MCRSLMLLRLANLPSGWVVLSQEILPFVPLVLGQELPQPRKLSAESSYKRAPLPLLLPQHLIPLRVLLPRLNHPELALHKPLKMTPRPNLPPLQTPKL